MTAEWLEPALASYLEASPNPVLAVRPDGRIVFANDAACTFLVYTRDDLLSMPLEGLVPEGQRAGHRTLRDDYFADLKARPMGRNRNLKALSGDGRELPVEISLSPIQTARGPVVFATMADLREQAEIQAELERSVAELERSNKDLEDFAYVASHDLQEPLRKIRSFADRLLDRAKGLDPKSQDFLDRMAQASRRMQDLIQDLLRFSRLSRSSLEPRWNELEPLWSEVQEDLALKISEVKAEIDAELLAKVWGDPGGLRQVLSNLLSNALKYAEPTRPLKVQLRTRSEAGGTRLEFEDNGIGIPPEHRRRVFQLFQRLHGRSGPEGTGMGLAVVQKILERHRGQISIEDPVGSSGTCFSLWFPRPEEGSAP